MKAKKIMALLLASVMTLSLAACGNNAAETEETMETMETMETQQKEILLQQKFQRTFSKMGNWLYGL